MRLVGHVARMGGESCLKGFGGGDLRERDHPEDLCIDRRIMLEWMFKK